MQISVRMGDIGRETGDLVVLAQIEGQPLPAEVAGLLEADDFSAKSGQTVLLYPRGALVARRLLLLGLGKADALDADALRRAAALAAQKTQELKLASFTLALPNSLNLSPAQIGQAFAEGAELGTYRYLRYKTDNHAPTTVTSATLLVAAEPETVQTGVAVGQAVAAGVTLARDLANGPGNAITPTVLGEVALDLAQRYGFQATVLDKAQLTEQGFHGILAVGQGSAQEPRFIVLEHGQAAEGVPTICLVGKGITFDTGGISIKPAEKMDDMKMDMGGAAAVLGTMQAVGELKLPLHVVGIICSAENMPSSTAYKPGDIVKTLSGKTIEVLNTDAEGRIVLADGLFYAQRYQPTAIIDLATLTGAMMVALGGFATGIMGTSQPLAERLIAAGEASGERVWQLPLWDEYRDVMKSDIADLKNTGGRYGGAITAGGFLAAFVGEWPWMHLDIAGTAWVERPMRPYQAKGATGVGVRLLIELLRGYI
ncbi:Leucyl aminopeptidase [Oscillochloris trichoides DG-6]|uniref:Probable cytosol aminopeptidase n=1 Tax=Oscillochloris trichoides DG-6 TaxID=765420 RepID=E1IIL8_9CHLR|nr:leucyl aminopeptidase [Oscillochloris trichoides]EFO78968.1 Leucyl aminopeptidase [Oscillochloris trichoides DG-6]